MNWVFGPDRCHVAAKDYVCFFCGEACEKGEAYWRRTGADGDGIWTMNMHPECRGAEAVRRWDDYDTFTPGSMKRGPR